MIMYLYIILFHQASEKTLEKDKLGQGGCYLDILKDMVNSASAIVYSRHYCAGKIRHFIINLFEDYNTARCLTKGLT
jgi:hypothetical protein